VVGAFTVSGTNLSILRDSVTQVRVLCLAAIETQLAPFCAAKTLLTTVLETDDNRSATIFPNMITIGVCAFVTKLYDTGTYFLTVLLLLGAHSSVLLYSQAVL
jgi:uncharacterized membrane protein YobD (UPF0266 family)